MTGCSTRATRASSSPSSTGGQSLYLLHEHATFEDGTTGVEAGLMEMLERMQTGRWKVFRHLAEWFQEFRLYHRKNGRVVKLADDLMSASRYAMMMRRFAEPEGGALGQADQIPADGDRMKWRVLVGLRAPGRAPERRQVTVQARDATAAAERAKWLFGGRERPSSCSSSRRRRPTDRMRAERISGRLRAAFFMEKRMSQGKEQQTAQE